MEHYRGWTVEYIEDGPYTGWYAAFEGRYNIGMQQLGPFKTKEDAFYAIDELMA